ncbi:MAG TPA: single-stranded-DNA-specific exonuclease RecJ [Pirellula sp.]|nr:single-stranded-DNA-specific exonuclease RecJ [Pirellula sp.]
MAKQWLFKGHDSAAILELAKKSSVEPVVAQLLLNRGITQHHAIDAFLEARFSDLREPELLPGSQAASKRIYAAIQDKIPITVYGDYDADGMTGTSILFSCLRLLGAEVQYFVPNRLEDSYGLSCDSIQKLAQRGRKMIISVDCGIGSIKEAELCRELGIDLIITDHHRMSEQLPDALAIVHPALPGYNYPFHGLCGAGVAFKLAWAICQHASQAKKVSTALREFLVQATTLAAIGTVADVVPLLDENRIIVRHALKLMQQHGPLGLKALMKQTKLDQKSALTAEDIAFTLAPRLNAAGRLGQAQLGIELLTTQDPQRAAVLAEYVDRLNGDRESLERSIVIAATKQAKEQFDIENDSAFVLAGPGWHLGVIGVVASRLSEKFHRPVVIIGMDSTGQKPATGSARSQGIIDLHATFRLCHEHLLTCGGHAAAAGLRIEERNIAAFRDAFCEAVSTHLNGQKPMASLQIDAEATFKQMNLNTVSTIESLSPFGSANPRPILVASNVELADPAKAMGNGDRHMSVKLTQYGSGMRGVAFGQADWIEPLNKHRGQIDIAFRPSVNEFNGMKRVELQLLDWRVAKIPVSPPHKPQSSEVEKANSVR